MTDDRHLEAGMVSFLKFFRALVVVIAAFLLLKREGTAAKDPIHHAILRVSDIKASVAAAKAAGATVERDIMTAPIGGSPIKIAMLIDPDGNALELMELPANLTHLPH